MRHSKLLHRAFVVFSFSLCSIAALFSNSLSWGGEALAIQSPEAQALQTAANVQDAAESTSRANALKRVTYDIEYMSSDAMGGRKPGTPGIKLCEDFLVAEYKKIGLKPLENGTYLQEFGVGGTRIVLEDKTELTLTGPNGAELKLELGKDYQQLTARRGFDLDAELVFVGYGIKADEHNYNEYANVDVEGKIVVLIRMEPQVDDPDSVFDGEETSRHSSGRGKITAARNARAAGIIMVNDQKMSNEERDELIQSDRFASTSLPFAHIKRSVFNEILQASPLISPLGKSLDNLNAIENLIDENLEPLSQPVDGWSASFKSDFERKQILTNNVIGIIEGEGPNADETIIIGGHYDHLGMGGGASSRAAGRIEIHNGADDNATGTAAILELARRFKQRNEKPGRRLVFICFSGEEMGLLGASHYVQNPIYPIEKTAVMINFDMIGWLRDEQLTLYNWNTSPQFNAIFDSANEGFGFELVKPTNRFGGSDHLPFNAAGVPNMFIHTGTNPVYHTPEDDFEAINCEGALRVIDYSERVVDRLASLEKRPSFGTPRPFRLGVMIDRDEDDGQVKIVGVTSGSVAERSGIQKGDIVLEVDGTKLAKRRDLTKIVRRDRGKTVQLKIKRGDAELVLEVVLKSSDE